MDFLMNYKAIKKGFKLLTIATIISSIVGCSSLPKEPYTYKNELKEFEEMKELPAGVLVVESKDGSKIEMVVNKNHKIKSITKESLSYNNIEECELKSSNDYQNVKYSLSYNGGRVDDDDEKSDKVSMYSTNKEFRIVFKNCYKENDTYKYNIKITPKNESKDIPKKITHAVLETLGAVIALPFIIVGTALAFIVAGIIVISFKIAGVKF